MTLGEYRYQPEADLLEELSGGSSVRRNELNLNYTLSFSPAGALRSPPTQLRYYALDATTWDVCVLVEAKASVDAATTDLPRLVRGLTLLAHADTHTAYSFRTQQGAVRLSGASLAALAGDGAALRRTVLYCCDAPVETAPRVLSPASRMQLLSAHASLEFAGALADGRDADCVDLEPVWRQLLESPRWRPVLDQYATLREVRELMVHPEDLRAAVDIATLAAEIHDEEEATNPNVVKAIGSLIAGRRMRALYFTRATAPTGDGPRYHHIGLYAYRRAALERFVKLPPSPLEKQERL